MFRVGVLKEPETASVVPLEVPVPEVKRHELLSVADQLMVEPVPGVMEDGVADRVTTGAAVTGGGVGVGPAGGDPAGAVPRPPPPLQAVRPKTDISIARETPK